MPICREEPPYIWQRVPGKGKRRAEMPVFAFVFAFGTGPGVPPL